MSDDSRNREVLPSRVGSGAAALVEQIDTERLIVGDRQAFVKMMADMLACAPDQETMKEFAKKFPDRYFYSLKLLGNLMGLAEKVEHEGTIIHAVVNMSDSEIIKKLEEMKMTMHHPMKNITNGPE